MEDPDRADNDIVPAVNGTPAGDDDGPRGNHQLRKGHQEGNDVRARPLLSSPRAEDVDHCRKASKRSDPPLDMESGRAEDEGDRTAYKINDVDKGDGASTLPSPRKASSLQRLGSLDGNKPPRVADRARPQEEEEEEQLLFEGDDDDMEEPRGDSNPEGDEGSPGSRKGDDDSPTGSPTGGDKEGKCNSPSGDGSRRDRREATKFDSNKVGGPQVSPSHDSQRRWRRRRSTGSTSSSDSGSRERRCPSASRSRSRSSPSTSSGTTRSRSRGRRSSSFGEERR